MVRNFIFRIPVLRALVPRVSRPLLPLTRLAANSEPIASLARQGGRNGTRLFHHTPVRLTSRSPSPSSPTETSLPADATLSQRLKYLIKSYGWYALGVYTLLTIVDFSVALAGVHIVGAEHAAKVTASIKHFVAGVFPSKPVEPGREELENAGHAATGGSDGFWAMVVLAYTIHKTLFFPIRVGLTAAITPRLVGWLRARGWAGSAGTQRAAQEMRERIRNRRSRD